MSVTPNDETPVPKTRAGRKDHYGRKRGRTMFIARAMVPPGIRDAYVAHAKAGATKYFVMKDPESDGYVFLRETRGHAGIEHTDCVGSVKTGRVAAVKRLIDKLVEDGSGYNKIVIASSDSRHG